MKRQKGRTAHGTFAVRKAQPLWLECVSGHCVDGPERGTFCQACLFKKLQVTVTTRSEITRQLLVHVYLANWCVDSYEKSEYLAGRTDEITSLGEALNEKRPDQCV